MAKPTYLFQQCKLTFSSDILFSFSSDNSASRFCIIIHFTLTMVSFLLSLTILIILEQEEPDEEEGDEDEADDEVIFSLEKAQVISKCCRVLLLLFYGM